MYILNFGKIELTFYYILDQYVIYNKNPLDTYKNKNLVQIKKRLEGNEIIICFLLKIKQISYNIDTKLISKRFSKIFIIEGANIIIKKQKKNFNIFLEVIRRDKDWKNKIINKLKLYKSFYDEINNSNYIGVPQLVLVCEDDGQVRELVEEIITQKCIIDMIKLYFSTDSKIRYNVLNSIVEVKIIENNRYQFINKKIKA